VLYQIIFFLDVAVVHADVLGGGLVSKTLGMVQLRVRLLQLDCSVKVIMGLWIPTLVEVDVAPVEVILGICFVVLDGLVVVFLCVLLVVQVVVCQTTVVVVERKVLFAGIVCSDVLSFFDDSLGV